MIRLMFLGDRRIAWRALRLLSRPVNRGAFDLQAIVTDPEIWRNHLRLHPDCTAAYVSCRTRETDQIRNLIKQRRVEALLSVQYNWILPLDVIQSVDGRAFNLHNGRLPAYRGYNSVSHAILNGDTVHHSTLHWMAEKVDSGDIAYVGETPVSSHDTALSLYLRTADAAVDAVAALLEDLSAGRTPPRRSISGETGRFYARESIAEIADVTQVTDGERLDQIVRAAYFPPANTAFMKVGDSKYLVLPESAASALAVRPANLPDFESVE